MSLSAKIFLGLGLGIATGIFLGEITAPLKGVGAAYVQLLQMAVLPYIMITLMSGIGKLKYGEAVRLSLRVGSLLVLIWALTFAVLYIFPLSFPNWQSASFFSSTMIEPPQRFNFLEFIPSNPFYSMANNIVPAVVLFSIAVGLALMGIESKAPLIAAFDVMEDALKRVTKFVSRLTPLGIFAIAASTAGTMDIEQLSRLQVYIVADILAALLMTFGVLPALIMVLTPLGYREIVWTTKDALLMAFATDNLLIVIPMLTDHGKELLRKGAGASVEAEHSVDVIVPISFNFPNVGRLLQLLFILFAAWFSKTVISLSGYVNLTVSALLSFFGKPIAAMPFLLDLLRLPADMMQLYLASGIFVAQFGTLASAMHLFTLAVLGGFAMAGALHIQCIKKSVPASIRARVHVFQGAYFIRRQPPAIATNRIGVVAALEIAPQQPRHIVFNEINLRVLNQIALKRLLRADTPRHDRVHREGQEELLRARIRRGLIIQADQYARHPEEPRDVT